MNKRRAKERAEAAEKWKALDRWRKATQPCKNAPNQPYVRSDGGCLRCDADCGEACRD